MENNNEPFFRRNILKKRKEEAKEGKTTDTPIAQLIAEERAKPIIKKYPTRKIYVYFPDQTWTSDLAQMTTQAKANDGYNYILNVIDVFSRYAWAEPLRGKTSPQILKAFEKIVEMNGGKTPKYLWTDQGGEYYNKTFSDYCKQHGITQYSTYGIHKASIAERFNRTLKEPMWIYFESKQTRRWIDILPKLIDEYNNTEHSSLEMTPKHAHEVKGEDLSDLIEHQYPHEDDKLLDEVLQDEAKVNGGKLLQPNPDIQKLMPKYKDYLADKGKGSNFGVAFSQKAPKYKVGDWVRVSRIKEIFEKGYEPKWSLEIYKIKEVKSTQPVTYTVEDTQGETIEGSFYEPELQLTKQRPDSEFHVEKVISTRKVKGKTQHLVKWLGYPEKFNSWVDANQVRDL